MLIRVNRKYFRLLQIKFKLNRQALRVVYEKIYEMICAICYHLYNLINVKNTNGGVLLSNTRPWGFSRFIKLYKRYQIAQRITYIQNNGETEQ